MRVRLILLQMAQRMIISYNSGERKAASNLSAGDEFLNEDGKMVYVEEVKIRRKY